MERNGLEYSSRRTSNRTRYAPERYGETVSNDEYLDYSNPSGVSRGATTTNSVTHSSSRVQNNPIPHNIVSQGPLVNRVAYMGGPPPYTIPATQPASSSVHRPPQNNSNNHLRNMPVYSYAGYSNRAFVNTQQGSNVIRRPLDFPMVSMNSFEIAEVICPLTAYVKNGKNDRHLPYHQLIQYRNLHYKYYIRFCKFDNKKNLQLDCLPKCFLLSLNGEALQIKTKYSGNPYEITRLINDKPKDIAFRVELPDPIEATSNFHYGIVAVKKVDLKYLITTLPKTPSDSVITINCVKQLLQHDDDIRMEGGEENNKLKVSLRCPYSSARLALPARSKHCKHVACFDLKSFIEMNEVSSKWRCPHCRDYIVVAELIVDGLLTRILKDAPAEANDAYIDIMGRYSYDVKREMIFPAVPVKRENNSPETVPVKRMRPDVECITISDSETEEESIPSSPQIQSRPQRFEPVNNADTTNSTLSPDSDSTEEEDSSGAECEIIFEKLPSPPPPRPARPRPNNVSRPRPIHAPSRDLSHSIPPSSSRNTTPPINGSYHSSSNLAKPVPMHTSKQQANPLHNSLASLLEQAGSSSYNNITPQQLPPTAKIVHNFYKTDQNSWQQKMSIRTTNSTPTNPPVPHYGIFEGLPPEGRPIFHPTYSNQPNIFQYSNGTVNYRNTVPYPNYSTSAFSNPRMQSNDTNNINNNMNNINMPNQTISYGYDRRQGSSQNGETPNCNYSNEHSHIQSNSNYHDGC